MLGNIENKSKIDYQKQIELAAEQLAQILIQQVISKNNQIKNKINNKYGESNR
ncbi:hypothetical protein HYW42_00890 [Candidatus Daviesbacteria bacterium]|nr:hypothetical protein [Candidatus Daviesbacteria bacterium]